LRPNGDQRLRLAAKAKGLERKLLAEIATNITPETIMARYRIVLYPWPFTIRSRHNRAASDSSWSPGRLSDDQFRLYQEFLTQLGPSARAARYKDVECQLGDLLARDVDGRERGNQVL